MAKTTPLKEWPKGKLPLGAWAQNALIDTFELGRLDGDTRRRLLKPIQEVAKRKGKTFNINDVNLPGLLLDFAHAVTVQLGALSPVPLGTAGMLTPFDRTHVLLSWLYGRQSKQPFSGDCGNAQCGLPVEGEIDLGELPVLTPEDGEIVRVGDRWGFEAAWPEYGIDSLVMLLRTSSEEGEASQKSLAGGNGDFWLMSSLIVDLNGKGKVTEEALGKLDDTTPDALIRISNEHLYGPDLRLDLVCEKCGTVTENGSVVDIASRFFGLTDMKGSPRIGKK